MTRPSRALPLDSTPEDAHASALAPRWLRPAARLALDGVDLALYREGRGPTVLLLPVPWGLSAPFLVDSLGPARKYATLVSFDPPGVGASGPASGERDLSSAAVARFARGVASALDLRDVTLLAVSGAVPAALELLADSAFAPRVARAALVSGFATARAAPFAPADAEAAARARAWRDAWRATGERVDVEAARALLAASPGAFASEDEGASLVLEELAKRERAEAIATRRPVVAREWATLDARALLPAIATPCWVLAGELDAVATLAASATLADGLPDAAFSRWAGASHFPFFEKPALFHRQFRSFVHGAGPPRSAIRGFRLDP